MPALNKDKITAVFGLYSRFMYVEAAYGIPSAQLNDQEIQRVLRNVKLRLKQTNTNSARGK